MPKRNPHFKLKPGQTDYTNIRWAPVVNCVVLYKGKMLLVQRNKDLNFYPGYWNGISGFLDDGKSLRDKVCEEVREELGLQAKDIISIKLAEIFDQEEPKYKKTWIVHPVLAQVRTDKIALDWEAQKFVWVTMAVAKKMKLLPGFLKVIERVETLRK